MLSEKEKYRYDRQIKLSSIGLAGQEKLKQARVLVVGAGGLGSPALLYLAAAGIGTIGVIDFDTVNETNLHRQILFSQKDIGNNKALAAADKLKNLNSHIAIQAYTKRLDALLALEIFEYYDVILDASDNFSTRYLINDVCVLLNKPFVYGSVFKTEGQVCVFNYENGPTYRCLFANPPQFAPSCEEVGVMGTVCGIIGAKQANEVLKIVTGTGDVLSGKLEIYDALKSATHVFSFSKNEASLALSLKTRQQLEAFNYSQFCGEEETRFIVDAPQLQKLMLTKSVQIYDIRQDWEEPKLDYENVVSIPLHEIEKAAQYLSRDKRIVVVCQYGTRSNMAVEYLRLKHQFKEVAHLQGGVVNFMAT